MIVGLPLTLRGEHGKQAAVYGVVRDGVAGRSSDVPVETADERFTTSLAAQRFGGNAAEDAAAAAHLLQSWLDRGARVVRR